MAISYEAKEWQNDSVGGTPITADEMNRIDSGVANAVSGVNELNEPGNVTTADIADGAVTADKLSQDVRDSVSQITVEGTTTYDLPENGLSTVEIPIELPDGYRKISLIGLRSGSSRGAVVNWVFTAAGISAAFVNLGAAQTDRQAYASVLCAKTL